MKTLTIPPGEFTVHTANGTNRSSAAPTISINTMAGSPLTSGSSAPVGGTVCLFNQGRLLVVVSGGLWVENAKAFQSTVLGEIKDSVRAVDLDLSGIVRFDTWALCTLLSLRRYFAARQIHFRLLDPSPRVGMILEMTKTRQLFEVIQTDAPLPEAGGVLDAHSSELRRAG